MSARSNCNSDFTPNIVGSLLKINYMKHTMRVIKMNIEQSEFKILKI